LGHVGHHYTQLKKKNDIKLIRMPVMCHFFRP